MQLLRPLLFIAACMQFAISTAAFAAEPAAPGAADKAKPKITIGKETTYITEPLRPDGYPDYVAALNQRMSAGVTPENNAAVLLQQAFGPHEIPESDRPRFFQQLGIKPLPESGDYFVGRREMIKRSRTAHPSTSEDDDLDEQFKRAVERPWAANDYAMVAQWLKVNEKPLRLVSEASRRPRWYFPIFLRENRPLIACRLPHDDQLREAADALVARAMLNARAGKASDAWQDLLVCHRLGRLNATGPLAIDTLVGYAVDGVATTGDAALFHAAKVSHNELLKMQNDLRLMPHFQDVSLTFDLGERLVFLDAVEHMAEEGLSAFGVSKDSEGAKLAKAIGESNVDWNVVMRTGNQWYDRLSKISRTADRLERFKAFEAYDNDLREFAAKANSRREAIWDVFTKGSLSDVISPRIAALNVKILMPALNAVQVAYDRTELMGEIDRTACALAVYRADRGHYPEKLSELIPNYMNQVPEDTFTHEGKTAVRYRREGNAYLLWSVGNDGIDDDGRSYDDDPPGDDWVLRPVPKEKVTAK